MCEKMWFDVTYIVKAPCTYSGCIHVAACISKYVKICDLFIHATTDIKYYCTVKRSNGFSDT